MSSNGRTPDSGSDYRGSAQKGEYSRIINKRVRDNVCSIVPPARRNWLSSLIFITEDMIYYTYLITNTKQNKYYIGSRQCEVDPIKDIGVKYFSSSTDEDFAQDQKQNPDDYEYRVLGLFANREDAFLYEMELHETYKASSNPSFYNRANCTSTGFNTSGTVTVKDKDGNTMKVPIDDPRYKSGELEHIAKGTVTVKDKDGNVMQVPIDDPRYKSGELVHNTKGTVTVKDKDGNTMKVPIDDPRFLSGELVPIAKGTVAVKDKDGNTTRVPIDDPRYKSGELNHIWDGKHHTDEAKAKIGKANSITQSGSGNSQYGKMWICNVELQENRKVSKTDDIPC